MGNVVKTDNISSVTFGTGARIRCSKNKEIKYLYNKIQSITNEFRIPATFATTEIRLPTVTKEILARLNSMQIRYKKFK